MKENNQSILLTIKKFIQLINISSLNQEIEYFKNKIKEDVGVLDYKTNVIGQMTSFKQYVENPVLGRIVNYILPKLNIEHLCGSSKRLPESLSLIDAWGNILKKGEYVHVHNHISSQFNSVLYFNEASIIIEGQEFFTKRGDVLTMPGNLNHHVNPSNIDNRITLVWNWDFIFPKWE
jgi:hypothetical protein